MHPSSIVNSQLDRLILAEEQGLDDLALAVENRRMIHLRKVAFKSVYDAFHRIQRENRQTSDTLIVVEHVTKVAAQFGNRIKTRSAELLFLEPGNPTLVTYDFWGYYY